MTKSSTVTPDTLDTTQADAPADTTPDTTADAGPTIFTVTFAGETDSYELVVSGMTFGEARAFEKVSGVTFTQIMQTPSLRGSSATLQALIWISMKRKIPTLTFAQTDDIAIDAIEWPDTETDDQDDAGSDGEGDAEVGPTSAADAE